MATTSGLSTPTLYPSPSVAALKLQFIGRNISDVQAPAAIIDVAVARRNCDLMLETAQALNVNFRAHVKTHKCTELSQLQVGGVDANHPVKLVASTVAEIEGLVPWLLECRRRAREVNVIYGLPVSPSAIPRLAAVAHVLGEGTISIFADHPDHVKALDQVDTAAWPGTIPVWINIDVGYHREGVAADSRQLADVARALAVSKRVHLAGVYTHYGSSYASNSPEEALEYLSHELEGLHAGALSFLKTLGSNAASDSRIGLSLGATPTVTSTQNLLHDTPAAKKYREKIEEINRTFAVELHAGVYPVMDMQQLATRARPKHTANDPSSSLLSFADLGFRVLAEVASVYLDRGEKPEALIGAGGIVLGREPCKSYDGWAVVTPWPAKSGPHYDPEGSRTGWIVGRISQEHGILTWEGPREDLRELKLGEKILLWPNHACIAGVNFGWYLVVDSSSEDPDRVQDVWLRWRGW